jgi:hypothetical protein
MPLTDEQWLAAWQRAGGSPRAMATATGISERRIYHRRDNMEKRGFFLPTVPQPNAHFTPRAEPIQRNYAKRHELTLTDGVIIVFSDAHWWPGLPRTLAHDALLLLIRRLKPAAVIANGDIFDGARISRHEPNGWENRPDVMGELDTVKVFMAEIAKAAKGAALLRTIGNHDIRFDRWLATRVPDYKHLAGMMLRDHLPDWAESWSVEINGDAIVKHRWHQGIHGTYNNALKGGRTIVTGHLHRLHATAWTDYNGRRWGIDTGTLSDPDAQAFDYAEDAPKNWGSGFAVLTYRGGVLAPPEFCEVIGPRAFFRGEVVHEQAKRVDAGGGVRPGGNESREGDDVPRAVGKRGVRDGKDASAKRGAAARPRAAAVGASVSRRSGKR